eukprot:COSAG01_NODE_44835_length_415_cov_0.743671_2_plen_45_part_01
MNLGVLVWVHSTLNLFGIALLSFVGLPFVLLWPMILCDQTHPGNR